MECLRCSDYDMISTHRIFRFSKQNWASNSMRKPESQLLVLKWRSNSRKLKNTKIRAGKRLRCEMWVEERADYARATSAAAAAAAALLLLRVLCAQRQSCEGCQSTPCACGVVCGVRCAVCVWRGHTPESPEHDHFFC